MTYNEFRLRFAIQYVGSVSDPDECKNRVKNAPILARLLWDEMNIPEDEVSLFASTDTCSLPANILNIKALAISALIISKNKAKWVAIDPNGEVWAFDKEPHIEEWKRTWDNPSANAWEIFKGVPRMTFKLKFMKF